GQGAVEGQSSEDPADRGVRQPRRAADPRRADLGSGPPDGGGVPRDGQRGQTVFLSSHILSEAEALCDRVGILRAGRLVDEGTLEELRHLSAQTIEVTFDGPAPQLDGLPGVHVASAGANALRLEVSGSVGPVIAALARHPVLALTSREPSLEEIFLHHYDSSDGRVGDS